MSVRVPTEIEDGPVGETSLELLQAVYRNRKQPLNVRVRCAVEALAHEYPRVSAVAVTSMLGQSFAEALEGAIARSQSPPLLNGPVEQLPASEPKKLAVRLISPGMTDELDDPFAPSEMNVEGSLFDPKVMARLWEETHQGLWFWKDWDVALIYRDLAFRSAGPIAS